MILIPLPDTPAYIRIFLIFPDGDECLRRSCSIFRKRCWSFPCRRRLFGERSTWRVGSSAANNVFFSPICHTYRRPTNNINVTSASRYRPPFNQRTAVKQTLCDWALSSLLVFCLADIAANRMRRLSGAERQKRTVGRLSRRYSALKITFNNIFSCLNLSHTPPFGYNYNLLS